MPVSSGEPLRIKASDWNDVLSMLRNWKGVQGSSPSVASLPALTMRLRTTDSSVRRPVFGEAVSLYYTGVSASPIEATLPLGESWAPSSSEAALPSFSCPTYQTLSPALQPNPQNADLHEPFAVCVDPRSMKFAIAGLALVRVRFISRWHRFVRRPILLPGDNNAVDGPRLTGCLDSSGHGPGQIIGVMATGATAAFQTVPWPFMVGPAEYDAPKVFWTLIRW